MVEPRVGLEMRGVTGRLLSGGRQVASLWTWEAKDLPGPRRLAVTVAHSHRHAYWWRHHTQPLVAELDVGTRVWRGAASIVNDSADGRVELIVEGIEIV